MREYAVPVINEITFDKNNFRRVFYETVVWLGHLK